MKKNLYATVLILIFAPTLVQVLDQVLPLLGMHATPGALIGRLFRDGGAWGRELLQWLTLLGFPPYASGSALGPFQPGGGPWVLMLNGVAVLLAGRRLLLPPQWSGNVLAPTFEKNQQWVAAIALVLLLVALLDSLLRLSLVASLDRLIHQISFNRLNGAGHLGAVLLAFTFWWTELRNLGRALAQAG